MLLPRLNRPSARRLSELIPLDSQGLSGAYAETQRLCHPESGCSTLLGTAGAVVSPAVLAARQHLVNG
jgi:hypothetical protein